jgi:phosphatidylserine/phosphatidylglycerophosphate/cardiolipin synthase-like enzyme
MSVSFESRAAPATASKYAIDSRITRVIRDIASRFESRLLGATPHNGNNLRIRNASGADLLVFERLVLWDWPRASRGVVRHENMDIPTSLNPVFLENWPFEARPDVYYDPRTAVRGPPWVSLHAKCVVVDQRFTLIGSANFTTRGQERNVEAGVLIEDEDFARRLAAQWQSLIDAGTMRRYGG